MILLYVVPAVAVIVLEAFFVYKASANRKRANLLADTPLTTVAELGGGPAKVQGRVVAFEEPLTAPLSGRPCVYFQFQVEEKRTQHSPHGAHSHWKTVITDVQSVSFGVQDDTGIAGLDLDAAELVLNGGTQVRSGFWSDAPPHLERLLQECYGRSSKGLIFNKGMRYTETRIEEGEDLLVLGDAQRTPGGNWEFAKGNGPYLISHRDEGALRSSYNGFALFWSLLAVLILLAPCVVLALLLLDW